MQFMPRPSVTLVATSRERFKVVATEGGPLPVLATRAAATASGTRISDEVYEMPLKEHQTFYGLMIANGIKCDMIPPRVLEQIAAAGVEKDATFSETFLRHKFIDDQGFAKNKHVGDLPRFIWKSLAPFQKLGVAFILKKKGRALLADEPGLGKTIQAIAASAAYKHEWPLLVVSPSSARFHWEAEFKHWLPEDFDDTEKQKILIVTSEKQVASGPLPKEVLVYVTSYDLIHRKGVRKFFEKLAPNVVICDECHYLKNGRAQRTKVLLPIIKHAKRAILLTGTPALSRPMEVFWQLHALDPLHWKDDKEFHKRYCAHSPKMKRKRTLRSGGASHLEELHTLLNATVMLRRNKSSILAQLPPKRRLRRRVKIDDANLAKSLKADLDEFRHRASELGGFMEKKRKKRRKTDTIDQIIDDDDDDSYYSPFSKKKKSSCGPSSRSSSSSSSEKNNSEEESEEDSPCDSSDDDDDDTSLKKRRRSMASEKKALLMDLFRRSGEAKLPAVSRRIRALLTAEADAENPDVVSPRGKILIFAHHRAVLDSLEKTALANIPHIRIDGSTPAKERQKRATQFQTDPAIRVALLGITAAGVALTLTAASFVLFAELYWTPAAVVQAEDRAHRIGQTSEVVVEYLLASDSVDDVLWPCIQHKMLILGELFENRGDQKLLGCSLDCTNDKKNIYDNHKKTKKYNNKESSSTANKQQHISLLDPGELEELHHDDPDAFDAANDHNKTTPATIEDDDD